MEREQNVFVLVRREDQIFSFLFQNGKVSEIHCDRDETGLTLGDIYVGRIKNVAKNIGAAFVEIAPGKICHLSLKDIQNPIYTKKGASKLPQQGDELLVQISKAEIKAKYPSVTTNLTFQGSYLLLTTGNISLSVSRKLGDGERARLRKLLGELRESYPQKDTGAEGLMAPETDRSDAGQREASAGIGLLARTNAEHASDEELQREYQSLYLRYRQLTAQAPFRSVFSCLWKAPAACLARLSSLYDAADCRIVTDDQKLYQDIQIYLKESQPHMHDRVELYQDKLLPLSKLYSLEHHLAQALNKKVWLDCGGYLVIEPTEALTVIDVNTGKYESGKDQEKSFLKVNLEAAREIARQLRLRNISGIIIVDFINMEKEESVRTLMSALRERLHLDPVPATLVDMTKLSLVEITRQKREKPLWESCKSF